MLTFVVVPITTPKFGVDNFLYKFIQEVQEVNKLSLETIKKLMHILYLYIIGANICTVMIRLASLS